MVVLLAVPRLALPAVLAGTQRNGRLLLGVQLGSKVLHVCVSGETQCDIGFPALGLTASHEQPAKHAQRQTATGAQLVPNSLLARAGSWETPASVGFQGLVVSWP